MGWWKPSRTGKVAGCWSRLPRSMSGVCVQGERFARMLYSPFGVQPAVFVGSVAGMLRLKLVVERVGECRCRAILSEVRVHG